MKEKIKEYIEKLKKIEIDLDCDELHDSNIAFGQLSATIAIRKELEEIIK